MSKVLAYFKAVKGWIEAHPYISIAVSSFILGFIV